MTELQNIALVYESTVLIVEDAKARLEYLLNKYRDAFATAVADSEYSATDHNYGSAWNDYKRTADNMFATIVNKADPTHGKYSEWLLVQLIKAYKAHNHKVADRIWFLLTMPEDTYKIADMLKAYDKVKHRLELQYRDINRLSYDQLEQIIKPYVDEAAELTKKELERKIKGEDTIKLVDNLDGWTVVVPLTKASARYYGAHTKWCTAARSDVDNMFDQYNNNGSIFIFINGDTKYQWWAHTAVYLERMKRYNDWQQAGGKQMSYEEEQYWEDQPDPDYLTDPDIMQFMNTLDHSVHVANVIPSSVWKAAFETTSTKGDVQKLKDSQKCLEDWWYEMS